MGCTSSSAVKDPDARKRNGDGESTARSKGSERKANRHNSMFTNYAEPAMSHQGVDELKKRDNSMDNLASITMDHVPSKEDLTEPEQSGEVGHVEQKPPVEAVSGENDTKQSLERTNSKGSIIRNGVYYSESELAEEGVPWQPKYWTPDRIGKWVEDTEFPDSMKFSEVRKTILQGNHNTGNKSHKSRRSSNSIG